MRSFFLLRMAIFGLKIIIVHIVLVKMDQLNVQKKFVQFYDVKLYVNLLISFCGDKMFF